MPSKSVQISELFNGYGQPVVDYVDLHNHIQKLEVVDPLTPTHLDKLIKKAINRREKLLLP